MRVEVTVDITLPDLSNDFGLSTNFAIDRRSFFGERSSNARKSLGFRLEAV